MDMERDSDPICGGDTIAPSLTISSQRRHELLGTTPGIPRSGGATRHLMHVVLRILKSWPRLMALHQTTHLPPMIHRVQLAGETPVPLANCYALVKLWADHTSSTAKLVHDSVLQEARRLLREVSPCTCVLSLSEYHG